MPVTNYIAAAVTVVQITRNLSVQTGGAKPRPATGQLWPRGNAS